MKIIIRSKEKSNMFISVLNRNKPYISWKYDMTNCLNHRNLAVQCICRKKINHSKNELNFLTN